MASTSQIENVYKVGYTEPEEREFRFSDSFLREDRKGTPLLRVSTSGSQVALLEKLLSLMPEPFWFLYILRVPRGEGEPGRYQSSASFTRAEVKTFLNKWRNFIEADARHNLWIKSEEDPALLVLDEHNLLYCYGPVKEWSEELSRSGWLEVAILDQALPHPHTHNYHAIFDDDARQILASVDWIHSPLQDQDE